MLEGTPYGRVEISLVALSVGLIGSSVST